MGNLLNSNAKPKGKNYLFIELKQKFVEPGQQIQGNVFLNLIEDIMVNCLTLSVKGMEATYQYNDNKTIKRSGKKIFYKQQIKLHSWESQTLPQGYYCFPITILMPQNQPQTFFFQNKEFLAIVQYEIKSKLRMAENVKIPSLKFISDLQIKDPLNIDKINQIQVHAVQQNQLLFGESLMIIKKCFCLDQGIIHIRCQFDRVNFSIGEFVNIVCNLDNSRGVQNVQWLKCTLYQKLIIKFSDNIAITKQIKIQSDKFDGIKAGFKDNNRVITIQIGKQISEKKKKSYQQLVHSSIESNLIKNQYFIIVKAIYQRLSCCTNSPSIEIPINIYSHANLEALQQQPVQMQNPVPYVYSNQQQPIMFDQNYINVDYNNFIRQNSQPQNYTYQQFGGYSMEPQVEHQTNNI